MTDLLWSLIGAVVGGGLSFLATWLFYRKSAEELREESSQLRKLNILALRGLEEADLVEFNHDEEGTPAGLHMKRTAASHASTFGGASATVSKAPLEQPGADEGAAKREDSNEAPTENE